MCPSQLIEPQAEASFDDVVRLLSRPAAYPERLARVLVRETHLSCVFLTDRYAYKLKKPVRFEFVDFRTLEARRRACEDEVRLNRRMAGEVYLGLVPVTRNPGGALRLGGNGPAVDWLVKMRRLPEDRMLDQLIESGRLREADVKRLAATLARFYHHAPPLLLQPERYRADLERHVRANRRDLLAEPSLPAPLVKRVHTAQLAFLRACPELLDARVCDGRIIDGHGDLRPEHVCLEHVPVVFDCLEFSQELRRLDVADELCFFAMECEYLGADFVGSRVLEEYRRQAGDCPPERLLWFYKCYRACVRAKVAALRSRQLGGLTAHDARRDEALRQSLAYLKLADGYARRLATPFLLVVRGRMGSGKTTLASLFAEAADVSRLGTDDVRQDLFSKSPEPTAYNAGRYTPAARQQVYAELFARADRLLAGGESAVLDGTFLTSASLTACRQLAARHGARLLVITCHCPPNIARQRIAARLSDGSDPSEARPEFLDRQREVEHVPVDVEVMKIDTTDGLPAEAVQQAFQRVVEWGAAESEFTAPVPSLLPVRTT